MSKTGPTFRYALAILAAIAALFLRGLLTPLLGNSNPYHTIWLAVVFSAWFCGLGPSIITTLLGIVGVWYWFLPPAHSWAIRDRADAYGLLGFLVFSGAIIALGESNRRGFATRSRLAAIVESSDDAIISEDLDGMITSWNKAAEEVFGYSAEEVIGKPISILAAPDRADEMPKFLERIENGERIVDYETVRKTKEGQLVNVSLTVSPVRDMGGQVIGASKIGRDITKQKGLEQELREAHGALERRVEERTGQLQVEIAERKAAERKLQDSEQSLRELSVRLITTQDDERRRIARELHDGVGQLLAAMSMNASKLEQERSKLSPDGARCAEENAKLIEQVSADIRTVSYLFHPPLLDEMGLYSALKWYVDGFTERSKITTSLELPTNGERLPQDYELCLFRIAQECLTNVHRHSGSSTVLVRLLRSPGEIKLDVSDQGKGFNQETQRKIASGDTAGVGLRGMRERLRQFGGGLEIRSNGKGTTVIATVPVPESRRSGDNLSSNNGEESQKRLPETKDDDLSSSTVVALGGKAPSRAAKV